MKQYVSISQEELEAMIIKITDTLESEGREFDTLYGLRDTLAEMAEDLNRRIE